MESKYFIAVSIFLLVVFLYKKLTQRYFKNKVYGEKYLKSWSGRTYYWQGAVFVSSSVTFLIILVLKSMNILVI